MKLMLSNTDGERGFALPTILLISIVMLTVLVSSIGAAGGSRVALDSQYYNELARHAAESGTARANACLKDSGFTPQWSTEASGAALTPTTGCNGTGTSFNAYLVDTPLLRTTFSVDAPSGSGIGSNLKVVGKAELLRASTNASGGKDVWRQYEYTTYLRIEPPETVACPSGFIPVPGNATFGTSNFCVAKYEAKNVGGSAASQAAGVPYVSITQSNASTAASNACTGCHLITDAEWLTIAHNVLNVNSNWTNGIVHSGTIYRGHTDNSPASPIAASSDDSSGYYATGNSASSGSSQLRTLRLSNGEIIWDFSGNVFEWTSGQTSGGQPGISGEASYSWKEWSAATTKGYAQTPAAPLWSPYPSFGTPAASTWSFAGDAIGQVYSRNGDASLRGFIRGGEFDDPNGYGVLSLAFVDPAIGRPDTGFRMAK